MNDLVVLELIELLTQVRTKDQLDTWVEESLLKHCQASSLLIGYGKMQSSFSLKPHYVTSSFPKSLIKTFDFQDTHLAVPMFNEWMETGRPVMSQLSEHGNQELLWQTMFRQKGFSRVGVAINMDQRNGQGTYVCITDPHFDRKALDNTIFQRQFSIIAPILHNVLTQIDYQLARERKEDKLRTLTPREVEILQWMKEGKTNFEISCILGISFSTIKNHVQKILIKLQVNNRTQAISKYS